MNWLIVISLFILIVLTFVLRPSRTKYFTDDSVDFMNDYEYFD